MKICNWKRFTTFIAIVLFLTIACLQQCSKKEYQVQDIQEYEVEEGDTLWNIGTEYRPEFMSIQEYIFNLEKFNNINSTIYPRQKIQILIYEGGEK